jgi:hypothetical protein
MANTIDELLKDSRLELRDFGVMFARLIAGLEVDPHGYFEKKYVARIERAQSDVEINGVVAQLVQWAVSSAVTDAQRDKINNELGKCQLPNVTELRRIYLP